jgi:hypothetical protein
MGERYFHNDINVGTELDGADVTRTILKAAAVALKVGAHGELRFDENPNSIGYISILLWIR